MAYRRLSAVYEIVSSVAVPLIYSVSGHADYKALLILSMSIMDCHVPHWMCSQQLLCRTVTAMLMHCAIPCYLRGPFAKE